MIIKTADKDWGYILKTQLNNWNKQHYSARNKPFC